MSWHVSRWQCIRPLKHLSKEALEAADDVIDLSEWTDMQFLLWDAQRRAGICDREITAAMEEKLKVNMTRQWPEPKNGEPHLHIKAEQHQEEWGDYLSFFRFPCCLHSVLSGDVVAGGQGSRVAT